jgi:ribonuclease HII
MNNKDDEQYKEGFKDGSKIAQYWKEKFERGIKVEREACIKIVERHVDNFQLNNYAKEMFKSTVKLLKLRNIYPESEDIWINK